MLTISDLGDMLVQLSKMEKKSSYNNHLWSSLCIMLLTDNAIRFSYEYNTIIQVIEPFVWTFGDSNSILLASLLLILLFSDMPFLDAGVPYFLMRTSRLKWLMGQTLYMSSSFYIHGFYISINHCNMC